VQRMRSEGEQNKGEQEMINRDNYHLRRAYLAYLAETKRRDTHTICQHKSALKRLLEWADSISFYEAYKLKPSFPAYVASQGLAVKTQEGIVTVARLFFEWLKKYKPEQTSKLTPLWMETFSVKRLPADEEHQAYTIEQIEKLVGNYKSTPYFVRAKGALALLFLSGMRIGAMVTMPISALDLTSRTVRQWPSLGVETKQRKKATTFLLDIPGLFGAVEKWDRIVRGQFSGDALWFAKLNINGNVLEANGGSSKSRQQSFIVSLRRLCEMEDIPYLSPHKIRHGHAVYALKLCQDIADLKAVSMNLMHKDISTTDGIYGILSRGDVQSRIEALK